MHVLGLNIGHNATACLLKDGKVVACISEERFSRIKNQSGIPARAIAYVLHANNITLNDLDLVVLDNHYSVDEDVDFGKHFYESFTKQSWKNHTLSKIGYNHPNQAKRYLDMKDKRQRRNRPQEMNQLRKDVAKHLHVPLEKICTIDHHLAHAYSTCFNVNTKKKTLIFTLDGEGSGSCATISIFDGKKPSSSCTIEKNSITRIYLHHCNNVSWYETLTT